MTRDGALWLLGVGIFALFCAASAGAQAPEASAGSIEERVLEIARPMAAALVGAKSFRMTAEIAYDAVQEDGQAIEFGVTRHVAVQRPNLSRVEVLDRSGVRLVLVYDGERIALSDELHNVYATAKHQGDLESMQAFARSALRIPTPLAEFLRPDLFELLAASESARWVDTQMIEGVLCNHLAFRSAETGLQIWIPREGDPLPRRVVITYEGEQGRPQFRANLRDWDLSPKLEPSLFRFKPARGAERIYFNTGVGILPGLPLEEGSR